MPSTMFGLIFPDRINPDDPKRYLCRYCGKPSVKPKQYYCSDDCYWSCQRAVAWWYARRGTFDRDGGKCVSCGKQLNFDATWDCHHIIPVAKLHTIASREVLDWEQTSEEEKRRGYAILYTLLVHDINNLVTLCSKCHKLMHAAKPETVVYEEPFTLEHFFLKPDV